MLSEYPWNSTYAFAENKLGLGTELEGKELKYINGKFVYAVQSGQGPSQIAEDINSKTNRELFGYGTNENGSLQVYYWYNVVLANLNAFEEKGRYKNNLDINDLGYTELNINPGDVLEIDFLNNKSNIIEMRQLQYNKEIDIGIESTRTQQINLTVASFDAAASAGEAGSFSAMITSKVPGNAPVWEAGRSIKMVSVSGGLGSVGVDVGFQVGNLSIDPTSSTSLTKLLSQDSATVSGGFISPIGVGGKSNVTKGSGLIIVTGGPAFGSPGPIISMTTGVVGSVETESPMSPVDSLKTAKRLSRIYRNSEFSQYVRERENSQETTTPIKY
jgi:hypothetical protein